MLKDKLIEKALEILEIEGIEKLSLRQIAKESNVSHNAPYFHFKNKRELLESIASYGFRDFENELLDQNKNILDIGIFYVASGIKRKNMWKLMFEVCAKPETEELKNVSLKVFELFVEKLQGERKIAINLWATVHGIVALYHAGFLENEFNDFDSLEDGIKAMLLTN